jgi:hypothetical protein
MTANNALMRLVDSLIRKIEPAHLKLYSTKEFQTLFERAGLHYITREHMAATIEVHIAEKSNFNA